MANFTGEVTLGLTDANGDRATMSFDSGIYPDTTTLATAATFVSSLLTALGAPGTITNAKVTSARFGFLYEKANPSGAVDAEYGSVTDGARLNFLNSAGGRGSTVIPAPISGIFAAAPMESTVDPASAVAAFITWYEAHVAGNGQLLNVYNGGVKVGRHARRRAQHRVA